MPTAKRGKKASKAKKKSKSKKAKGGRKAPSTGRASSARRVAARGEEAARGGVTREELIAGLNEDLSWEFNAIISYRLFASLCTGPHRQELRQFFESEIPDELAHAQLLADKIVALGGSPATEPAPVEVTTHNRRMLELALKAERDTVRRYKTRVNQADELGEVALKVQLEGLIVDETGHAEEIERILTNWKR